MLFRDGIHDDTEAFQKLLDTKGYIFIESGTYLISKPLIIHSDTELHLAADATVKLASGADCAILENDALPEKGGQHNTNIRIHGGIWDGNNIAQNRRSRKSRFELTHFEDDYYYGILMRFVGVSNFHIDSLTVKDPESYAMLICAADNFSVENIHFDYNMLRNNMDGIHIQGPAKYGAIRNIMGATNDDLVALNCDDVFASEITRGNIENITVDGLYSENGYTALRLLSCGSEMRNISIKNIFGTYRFYGVSFTHHKVHPGEKIWFDNIFIEGIFASKPEDDNSDRPIIWFEEGVRAGNVTIKDVFRTEKVSSNAPTLRLTGDVKINCLTLDGIHESLPGDISMIMLDRDCADNLICREADTLGR